MGSNLKGRFGLFGRIAWAVLACGSGFASGFSATITYDWQNNAPSLLDWTVTQEKAGATVANGDSGVIVNQFAPRGTFGVGQNQLDPDGEPTEVVQDGLHVTLVLTSPAFYLTPTSEFSFLLSGGAVGDSPFADFSNLSALIDTLTDNGGFAGLCLRDVLTGEYLLRASKDANGDDLEWVGWTAADLATAGADLTGRTAYVLDLVDKKDGHWGWVKMMEAKLDGVEITPNPVPEPAAAALLSLGLLGLCLRCLHPHGIGSFLRITRGPSITTNRPAV